MFNPFLYVAIFAAAAAGFFFCPVAAVHANVYYGVMWASLVMAVVSALKTGSRCDCGRK